MLTSQKINPLIADFYERVRNDPELGPIFTARLDGQNEHLDTLVDFWSLALLAVTEHQGHLVAGESSEVEDSGTFLSTRWLRVWRETANDHLLGSPETSIPVSHEQVKTCGQDQTH